MNIFYENWIELPVDMKVVLLKRARMMLSKKRVTSWPKIHQLRNLKTGRIYKPNHPNSSSFHCSKLRFRFLLGGLGSGKTAAASMEALKRIRAGLNGIIVSPSEKHFKRSTFEEFSRWVPWEHMVRQNKAEGWWEFDTGSKVWYCGLGNPDSVRGTPVNWAWGDELAMMPDDSAWKNLIGRIREGPNPSIFVTTTPRPHWLKRVCVTERPRLEDGRPLLGLFVVPTEANKHNLDPLYYASLKASYTDVFARQELGGEFVSYEGLVYSNFVLSDWPGGNLCSDDPDMSKKGGFLLNPVEMSFDDGYRDPRAMHLIQVSAESIFVFYELYHTQHTEDVCVKELEDTCKENDWPLPELSVGSHEATTLRSYLRKAGVPARYDLSHKIVQRIRNLRRLICDGNNRRILKVHPRCVNLIKEMTEGYRYKEDVDGLNYNNELPMDRENHACDGLGVWAWARARNSFLG